MTDRSNAFDSLVSTEWLQDNLDRADLVVVDIRGYVKTVDVGEGKQVSTYEGAPGEYAEAHIPGAVFVDWTKDVIDHDADVSVQVSPPDRFAEAMALRGIGDVTAVVVADHAGGHFATRLWWALKYYGHDEVAILNGGYAHWIAEGRPLTAEAPIVEPKVFTPAVQPGLRVEPEDILEAIGVEGRRIVDARDEETYRGDVYRGPRRGHIKGAVNLPAKSLTGSDGAWLSNDELRERVEAAGIGPDDHVISYCNGGVTATAVLFALDRIGHGSYANYDGSWNEWGERSELPIETGEGS